MQSLEFCSQIYIEYKEDQSNFIRNTSLIEKWENETIPTECDPFNQRRYLQRISLALLVFSIVLQFIYGKGFKANYINKETDYNL